MGNRPAQDPATIACRFDGPQKTATALSVGGIAKLDFFGWLIPRGSVTSTGDCRLLLAVSTRPLGGTWSPTTQVEAQPFVVAPHDRVRITATARMRDWLKPAQSGGCSSDDAGGQLGVRVTAGPTGGDCRANFLSGSNHTHADWNFNALPEAVLVSSVTWRLESNGNKCSLCDDASPTGPVCRGGIGPPIGKFPYRANMIGPTVREGTETQGAGGAQLYAIFTGPPQTPRDANILEPRQGVIIATNTAGVWRSYGMEAAARLACDHWLPPPADVERTVSSRIAEAGTRIKNAARRAFGFADEPLPPPPPAIPSLRLVLDSWEFLRPQSVTLPFE